MSKKLIIKFLIEVVFIAAIVLLVVGVFKVDLTFGKITFANVDLLMEQKSVIKSLDNKLEKDKTTYNSNEDKLNTAKKSYDTEKSSYEGITDEVVQMLNSAPTSEQYRMEYLMIRIGNYAAKNNLKTLNIPNMAASDDNAIAGQAENSEVSIKVTGTYINVAEFVFDLENDSALMFLLQNISITYAGENKVCLTFDINDINLVR